MMFEMIPTRENLMRKALRPSKPHGFTLVEILIVISIIGLLLVLVTPSVIRVRDQAYRQTCQSNQRVIRDAVDMYFMDRANHENHELPVLEDLAPFLRGRVPQCPADGTYSLIGEADGIECLCSIEAHNL